MDVVCERCQTEYEFDDALVSERGTTVKCTNCGHQFKIYRPASTSLVGTGSWSLRRPDGTTITFDSLAVLQKWIIEGRVTRVDQISRNGEGWKPLGSIAELESFFATAELRTNTMRGGTMSGAGGPKKPPSTPPPLPAGRSHRPPPTPPAASGAAPTSQGTGTLRPGAPSETVPSSTAPSSAGVPAIPPPARTPTLGGTERTHNGNGAAATASPGFSMGGATTSASESDGFEFGEATGIVEQWNDRSKPAIGPPPPKAATTAPTVAVRRPPPTPPATPAARVDSAPPPGRRVVTPDELPTQSRSLKSLDLPEAPARRGSGALIGVVAGVVVTLGGVALVWKLGHFGGGSATTTTTVPPPAEDHVGEAVARTATQTRTATRGALDEATGELTVLLASDPTEPRLHAARAEALALLGEQTRQRADDLEARAAAGGPDAPSLHAEAGMNRRDVGTTLERASQDVHTAEAGATRVTRAADQVRLHVALGEATRVLGDMSAAHRHLDGARAAGGGPEVDLLAALLARDEGNADGAIESLRTAAARPETGVRAHLALGRLLAARGDAPGARAAVDAVTAELPNDDDARALALAIAAGQPPFRGSAPAVAAVADAGSAAHVAVVAHGDAGAAVGGEAAGAGLAGRSYDALIAEGDRLAEHGQHDRARAAYNAAIAMRPDASEAIAGLGWVELDGGSATLAINHFRHALSINPRYSEAYIGLGEAYASLNDFASALRAYRQYIDVNPDGSRASMAQRQIQQIQQRLGSATTAPPPAGGSDNGTGAPTGSGSSGGGAAEPAPAPTPAPSSAGSTGGAAPAPAGGP